MDSQLTSQQVWLSVLLFAALDVVVLAPVVFLFKADEFRPAVRPVVTASAIFWGIFAVAVIWGFWEMFYQHIYPTWVRWLAPLDVLLYGGIGLGLEYVLYWALVTAPNPKRVGLLGICTRALPPQGK